MPSNYIYISENNQEDPSRWLHVTMRAQGLCMLHLTDLCQPGRVSGLTSVLCDQSALIEAAEKGAMQITLPNGYVLLRRVEEMVSIEFKCNGDAAPTRVEVSADKLLRRLNNLRMDSMPMATAAVSAAHGVGLQS